jgi:hypothetical protein
LTASVQREIVPRVSVNAAYTRRSYTNLTVINNLAAGPSSYSPYCITTPTDTRLPGGGNQQICGLYDITPGLVGQLNRVQTFASNFGDQYEHWNGFDLSVDARLPSTILLQGGVSSGRTVTDNCDIVSKINNPSPLYCHVALPLVPNMKLLGAYTLPIQVQVAATFQSIPGNSIQAQYVATNAQIAPSLGRNLAVGPNGTATVNIVPPGSMLTDRVNQLDLRVSRPFVFKAGAKLMKMKGIFDIYNLANVSPVLVVNNTYGTRGAAWLSPLQILAGRLFKVAAQVDF